jgi:hypothetical protein
MRRRSEAASAPLNSVPLNSKTSQQLAAARRASVTSTPIRPRRKDVRCTN